MKNAPVDSRRFPLARAAPALYRCGLWKFQVYRRVLLLSDCDEAYNEGILQHVDGFQYPLIKPRSADAPFKACCYVHNNISKLSNLYFSSTE